MAVPGFSCSHKPSGSFTCLPRTAAPGSFCFSPCESPFCSAPQAAASTFLWEPRHGQSSTAWLCRRLQDLNSCLFPRAPFFSQPQRQALPPLKKLCGFSGVPDSPTDPKTADIETITPTQPAVNDCAPHPGWAMPGDAVGSFSSIFSLGMRLQGRRASRRSDRPEVPRRERESAAVPSSGLL